jgi:uncharacterized protein (DUF433 family)
MAELLNMEEAEAVQHGALSYPDRKQQRWGEFFWREAGPFDWTECDDVEVVVGRLSGVPTLVNTRFSADNLLSLHEDGMTAAQIVEDYDLELSQVERALQFAEMKKRDIQAA